ncbi:ATP-dependent Clp protease adaptor ClpS [Alienimonas sp. DA493]|uniref:ATP-dependent Clp protease adaptor ClpS n=1 Tax=Alienimonas sp. DA493 TaxID=3373605 RepID=UPI0037551ADE
MPETADPHDTDEPGFEPGGVSFDVPDLDTLGGGAATGTAVAEPKTKRKTKPHRNPRYAVIVENDEDHTFSYLVDVLRAVCAHTKEDAERLTDKIDKTGRAAVWTGPLEVAELKRDQIREFGPDNYNKPPVTVPLQVTIEPIDPD